MSDKPDLTDRQRLMLRALIRGAAERAAAEDAAALEYHSRLEAAEGLHEEESKALADRHTAEAEGAAYEQAETRAAAVVRHDAEQVAARKDFVNERYALREE